MNRDKFRVRKFGAEWYVLAPAQGKWSVVVESTDDWYFAIDTAFREAEFYAEDHS